MEETRTKLSRCASHREEGRTKLSSKACPFRPIVPSVGSSSTIASLSTAGTITSAGPFAAYSSDSALDSSTGSVGSWANGQLMVSLPLPTSLAYPAWPDFTPFAADGQGTPSSPQGGKGEFKLGDFSSRLRQRAQAQASQEQPMTRVDPGFSFENVWSGDAWIRQALMVESFAGSRNSSGKGSRPESSMAAASERRKAMNQAMCQSVQPPQPSELRPP